MWSDSKLPGHKLRSLSDDEEQQDEEDSVVSFNFVLFDGSGVVWFVWSGFIVGY